MANISHNIDSDISSNLIRACPCGNSSFLSFSFRSAINRRLVSENDSLLHGQPFFSFSFPFPVVDRANLLQRLVNRG